MTIPPIAPAEGQTRILLVDDDRDDYLLTRDYLKEIPGFRFHLDWVADYENARAAIANTSCIVFNSRGVPVDDNDLSTAADAIYVTDGTAVYVATVAATVLELDE